MLSIFVKGRIKALVFDAYGTLFDVHSIAARCDRVFPGKGVMLSEVWRAKQLEYTWLRSLMGRYEDFWNVTESALIAACLVVRLDCPDSIRHELMDAYLQLEPFSDAVSVLPSLQEYKRVVLSNGSPRMLRQVIDYSGLAAHIDEVISVHDAEVYKPTPSVYELALSRTAVTRSEIAFISSNYWDAVGAKSFGYQTYWANRSDACREELGLTPDATGDGLLGLFDFLQAQRNSMEGIGTCGGQD